MQLTLETVLPVFAVVALGYALARRRRLDLDTLSDIAFLVAAPCLIFTELARNKLEAREILTLVGGTTFTAVAVAAVTLLAVRRSSTPLRGMVMSASLWNAGNLALPCSRMAFGEEGLAHATIVFVERLLEPLGQRRERAGGREVVVQ